MNVLSDDYPKREGFRLLIRLEDVSIFYGKEGRLDGGTGGCATSKRLYQRLIITYSPKYAAYQKTLRETQIERAKKMLKSGTIKRVKKNPTDPARFIDKISATQNGEIADTYYFLNTDKLHECCGFRTDYQFISKSKMKTIEKLSKGRK